MDCVSATSSAISKAKATHVFHTYIHTLVLDFNFGDILSIFSTVILSKFHVRWKLPCVDNFNTPQESIFGEQFSEHNTKS